MFGRILSNYHLSAAAVVVQNLLEIHGSGGAIARNAGTIANKLVGGVYNGDPALFDGKRGKRPHKLSLAAMALANGVKVMSNDAEGRSCFHLSLGTLLLQLASNPQDYALSGNDHFLLGLAEEVYLSGASTPIMDGIDRCLSKQDTGETALPQGSANKDASAPVLAPADPMLQRKRGR